MTSFEIDFISKITRISFEFKLRANIYFFFIIYDLKFKYKLC